MILFRHGSFAEGPGPLPGLVVCAAAGAYDRAAAGCRGRRIV